MKIFQKIKFREIILADQKDTPMGTFLAGQVPRTRFGEVWSFSRSGLDPSGMELGQNRGQKWSKLVIFGSRGQKWAKIGLKNGSIFLTGFGGFVDFYPKMGQKSTKRGQGAWPRLSGLLKEPN